MICMILSTWYHTQTILIELTQQSTWKYGEIYIVETRTISRPKRCILREEGTENIHIKEHHRRYVA